MDFLGNHGVNELWSMQQADPLWRNKNIGRTSAVSADSHSAHGAPPQLRLRQNLFLLLSHICVSSLSVGYWLIKRRALHISVLSKGSTGHPSICLSGVCFINIGSLEDDLYDGKDLGIHENYFLLHLLLQVNLCVKNLLGQCR